MQELELHEKAHARNARTGLLDKLDLGFSHTTRNHKVVDDQHGPEDMGEVMLAFFEKNGQNVPVNESAVSNSLKRNFTAAHANQGKVSLAK